MEILKNFNIEQVIAVVASVGAVILAFFKMLNRYNLTGFIKRLLNVEPGFNDLKDAMDNMSTIVYSQGQSIDWLTQQLVVYREELDQAREKLKEMENLQQENVQLKIRVQELESQVKSLEDELARRKKYTPKKYLEEGDNDVDTK